MNFFLLMVYVTLSTGGATLIKVGGSEKHALLTIPFTSIEISITSLFGIFLYGLSFLVFIVLLNKLNMSYLVPVATGVSYVLLMASSVTVFNEEFTLPKAIGCILIVVGVLLVLINGTSAAGPAS